MKYNPIELDLSSDGSNLYVFFGGIGSGIAMPPFEFYESSKILEDKKIFVRDFCQSWYQLGLPNVGNDLYAIREWLRTTIALVKPEKVIFVGNSMGGFAAILFASLLKTGEVIAFAPQTFISPALRYKYSDNRWMKQIFGAYIRGMMKPKVWDLRPLLKNNKRKISIFVSRDDVLDSKHASHVRDMPNVHVYEFTGGGHSLVRMLRDSGQLPVIMSGEYCSR